MKESNMYQLIEDYLVGNLKGNRLIRFKSALNSDNELAREVAIQKDILEALTPKPEDALLQNLKRLSQLYSTSEQATSKTDYE